MNLKTKAALAVSLATVLTLGMGVSANAAQVQGTRQCSGTRAPVVYINSSGGSGTWTKYDSPSTQTPFTFPSGAISKSAPYQATYYYLVANTFHTSPTSTCI